MSFDEFSYINQDGTRWANRQIKIHAIKNRFARELLRTMAEHADTGGVLYPSQSRLASMTEAHLRSVERTIAFFKQLGLIRTEVCRVGRSWTNTYHLNQWLSLSPADCAFTPTQSSVSPRSQTRVHPDSPVLFTPTPGPGKDSIEDSKEVRANSRAFANEKIVEDDRPPSAGTHSPVACSDPAVEPRESVIAWRVRIWNAANLVPIERSLTRGEAISLQKALKHPALAKDDDAWRRYVRWVRDDTFLGGKAADGYKADLRQAVAARHIDRWAAQDQGPPVAAASSAPMNVAIPVLPGMVIPTVAGMTSRELRNNPVTLAAFAAHRAESREAFRLAVEEDMAVSGDPRGLSGDVGRRSGNGPPDRAREMADA